MRGRLIEKAGIDRFGRSIQFTAPGIVQERELRAA
jgi:hypothetical protein